MTEKDWELAEPHADALVESLRSFGYSPEAAVADLVDNSLSAGSREIDVQFHWNGAASWVSISDDGEGMTGDELANAMRPGSKNPLAARRDEDLGRFGLGLKTASFSQARELTVLTRREGATIPEVRRWDLDVVAATREWRLLRTAPDDAPVTRDGRGTTVLWTKCDRLVGDADVDDAAAQRRFNALASRVGLHLGATFHTFLTARGASRVTIRLNGARIKPWDPFLLDREATEIVAQEELPLKGSTVKVTAYVLPHRSKLSDAQADAGKGLNGWNGHQGFYLYRGGRLLVMGDWLGIGGAKEEHTKLARIRVDFPAALDLDWQVDVKKSSARVPGPLRADLSRIATLTRRRAEGVYRHRGKTMTQRSTQDFVLSWEQVRTREGVKYRINRSHPVMEALRASATDKRAVDRALRFIEETIPTTLIGVSLADSLDHQPVPFEEAVAEVSPLLKFAHQRLCADGLDPLEALERLATVDPFVHHPSVVQAFRETL